MKTQEIWNTFLDVMFAIEKEMLQTFGNGNENVQKIIEKPKNKRSHMNQTSVLNVWSAAEAEAPGTVDEIINRHIRPYEYIQYDPIIELLEVKTDSLKYSIVTMRGGISSFLDMQKPHKVDGKCKAAKPRIENESKSDTLWHYMQNKVSKEENDKRVKVLREWAEIINRFRKCRDFSSGVGVVGNGVLVLMKDETAARETIKKVYRLLNGDAAIRPNEYLQAIDLNAKLVTY